MKGINQRTRGIYTIVIYTLLCWVSIGPRDDEDENIKSHVCHKTGVLG